ncbi:MAG TPA: ABC transporter permease [Actinobacteria bacterium]|nr:ABC transporter permease [Actinomycetota bacterium]
MIFILVFSFALGGSAGGGEAERKTEVPVVYDRSDPLAKEAVDALKEIKGLKVEIKNEGHRLTAERVETLIKNGDRSLGLVFPSDFGKKLARGQVAKVKLISDPAADATLVGPIQGTVSGVLEEITAPLLIRQGIESVFKRAGPPNGASASNQTAPSPVSAESIIMEMTKVSSERLAVVAKTRPKGIKLAKDPTIVQHNVPAYTTMFVFFIVMIIAESVLSEKSNGTFRRLLAAPLGKTTILVGKLVPYYVINLAQIAIMFGIGRLVFGMSLGRSLSGLILISMALAAAATSLGLLVAAFAKTNAQVNSLGVLLVLLLAALGGSMIPIAVMPELMQDLAQISPHSWAIAGFQDIIVRGHGISEIIPDVAALLVFAAVFFTVGLIRFRFD